MSEDTATTPNNAAAPPDAPTASEPTAEGSGAAKPGFVWRTLLGGTGPGAMLYAAVSGLLLAIAFPPYGFWPLIFVALIPWYTALARVGWGTAILSAFAFGGTYLGLGIGWLTILSPAALWATLGVLCVHYAVFALLVRPFLRRQSALAPLAVAYGWIGVEALRTFVDAPLPFPWLLTGTASVPFHPFVQIADLGGVLLISGLLAYVNASLAQAWTSATTLSAEQPRRRIAWRQPVLAAALVGVATLYGTVRLGQFEAEGAMFDGPAVTIVQPNYVFRGQGIPDRLDRNVSMTDEAIRDADPATRPDLVLWFEAVFFGLDGMSDDESLEWLMTGYQWRLWHARNGYPTSEVRPGTRMPTPEAWPYELIGTTFTTEIDVPGREQHYARSSASLIRPDGSVAGRYHKQDLVPMGEYVPYYELGFVRDIVASAFESQGFSRIPATLPGEKSSRFVMNPTATGGTTVANPYHDQGHYEFGAPICYELVFPDTIRSISRANAEFGDRPVDFLCNISDEGWYQTSPELEQMLQAGVLRAIENRRSIVRGTNTGISGFIDPTGTLHDMIEDENGNRAEVGPDYLTARVRVTAANSVYRTIGDWPPVLAAIGLFVMLIGLFVRRGKPRDDETAAADEAAAA